MSRTFALFSSITTSRRPGPGARVCRRYLYIFYLIYDLYRDLYRDRYSKSSEIAGRRAGAPGQGGRVMHFENVRGVGSRLNDGRLAGRDRHEGRGVRTALGRSAQEAGGGWVA